jgi:hypothetical protein
VVCYCEGDLYKFDQLDRYFERLKVVASDCMRQVWNAATVQVPIEDVIEVGTYDASRFVIHDIMHSDLLEAWSGEPIEGIAGVRLPIGPTTLGAVTAATNNCPILNEHSCDGSYWVKTQAGQVVQVFLQTARATVFEHSDPALKGLLCGLISRHDAKFLYGEWCVE